MSNIHHPRLETLEPRFFLSATDATAELFESADVVDVEPAGSVVLDGTLDEGAHSYRFETPAHGEFQIDMEAVQGDLDPMIALYMERHGFTRRVDWNDDAETGTQDSSLSFRMQPGTSYCLVAMSANDAAGDYQLTLTSLPQDDYGTDLDSANEIRITRAGRGRGRGSIDYQGDVDLMQVQAVTTGPMDIDVRSLLRTYDINATVTVYDSEGNPVSDDGGSNVSLETVAGETYYVGVSGDYAGRFSRYVVEVNSPIDDFGNTLATAEEMLMRRGRAIARGSIDWDTDVDTLAVQAESDGPLQISVAGFSWRSDMNPDVAVYDAGGELLGTAAGTNTASLAIEEAIAGQTYYVQVAGDYAERGTRYTVQVLSPVDDAGNSFDEAGQLSVTRGRGQALGSIDWSSDVDVYRVEAPSSGPMEIEAASSFRGSDDPDLAIYDADGNTLAVTGGGDQEILAVNADEGQTYFLAIRGGYDPRFSRYRILITTPMDDIGNTLDEAREIRLNRLGTGRSFGSIDWDADQDVFGVQATKTGRMDVKVGSWGRGFDPEIVVYDAAGNEVAYDEENGYNTDSRAVFNVTEGETYYLNVSSVNGGSQGRYRVMVETDDAPQPPVPQDDDESNVDPTPTPDTPTADADVRAETYVSGGQTFLRVVGTERDDNILVSQDGNSVTVSAANYNESFSGAFAGIELYGLDGADVLRLADPLDLPADVFGGEGNDRIFAAGQGAHSIWGQGGNDLMVSIGGGADTLRGGLGQDSFWGDATDIIADATTAERSIGAVHSVGSFYQPWTSDTASSDYVSLEIAGQNFRDPETTAYTDDWADFSSSPLFVNGVAYDDIQQGGIGDCYFLASLSGLAITDPHVLEQMIAPMGDGTYAVRYYRGGEQVYLRIDGDLPVNSVGGLVYARTGEGGEIWVPLLEKAFAHFRYGQNSYASLNGGWMSTTLREMTGGYTDTQFTSGSAGALYNYIASHLNQGHAVTLGSNYNADSPVVGAHAYTVHSVETSDGQNYVTVYNPWGWDGRTWDSDRSDGLLRLSINQIQENFSAAVTSLA